MMMPGNAPQVSVQEATEAIVEQQDLLKVLKLLVAAAQFSTCDSLVIDMARAVIQKAEVYHVEPD
jgi:hypothetical protein